MKQFIAKILLGCVLGATLREASCRETRFQRHARQQRKLADDWLRQNPRDSSSTSDKDDPMGVTMDSCPCDDEAWCQAITGHPIRPQGEVFGFTPFLKTGETFNWTHLSTVAWGNDVILCQAHKHGVRAVSGPPSFNLTLLAEKPLLIGSWALDALHYVQGRFLDGLTFDFEEPLEMNDPEANAYVDLIQQTRTTLQEINPSLQVTVCVPWSPDSIDGRNYPFVRLAVAVDAMYVMDYDTRSQVFDACIAGANAPFPGTQLGIRRYLQLGVPSWKMMLGVPWYGYRYSCLNGTKLEDKYCPIELAPFRGVACSDAVGKQHTNLKIQKLIRDSKKDSSVGDVTISPVWYDEYQEASFFNSLEEGGVVAQYWFDSPESLRHKVSWASKQNLAGVGPYCFDDLNWPGEDPEADQEYIKSIWSSFDAFMIWRNTSLMESRFG